MEEEDHRTFQRINYTVLVVSLVLVSLVLGGVIWITTRAYGQGDDQTRRLLYQLAWVATVTLGITLLLLMFVILRWIRLRLKPPTKLPETHYIDAWSEAGKRIRLPDAGNGNNEEDEPQP